MTLVIRDREGRPTRFGEVAEHTDGERELWRAVIRQAMQDACTPLQATTLLEQRQARTFLQGTTRWFTAVCHLAELDPDNVRELASRRIAEAPPLGAPRPSATKFGTARPAKVYTFGDVSLTLLEWSQRLGVSTAALHGRMKRQLPLAEVFAPRKPKRGGRSKLPKSTGDRRGEVNARPEVIGDFGP